MQKLLDIIKQYGDILKEYGIERPIFLMARNAANIFKDPFFIKHAAKLFENTKEIKTPGALCEYDGVLVVEAHNWNMRLDSEPKFEEMACKNCFHSSKAYGWGKVKCKRGSPNRENNETNWPELDKDNYCGEYKPKTEKGRLVWLVEE